MLLFSIALTALIPQKISKNSDLDAINTWFSLNKLSLNISKAKFMVYSTNSLGKRFSDIALNIGSETIDRVKKFKYLGVAFDENLS